MSFKNLNDSKRQAALVPFLQAADCIDGHLVVFVVHKSIQLHPMSKKDAMRWHAALQLSAKWKHKSFADAMIKAHFFALLVAQWAMPLTDVTWISDQDEFVANKARLDDTQQLAARLSTLYLSHKLRIFAMNTTQIDAAEREYEDFVAIPDLAAGMLAELSSCLSKFEPWSKLDGRTAVDPLLLQSKTELLVDWFWYAEAPLRRTCIVIDKCQKQSRVFKLDQSLEYDWDEDI